MKIKLLINFDEMQDKRKLYDYLKSLHGNHEVYFKQIRAMRSNNQNSYYWGVVLPYALQGVNNEGNEWNLDELHEYFKTEFLKEQKIMLVNEREKIVTTIKSTTELDTKEFTDYIDKIVRWCAEQFAIEIPSC